MSSDPTGHVPFTTDGFRAEWTDAEHTEELALTWENEGWTAVGSVGSARIQYVLRITAQWQVSQFLLFRDLEEADLWLGTDGHGRWGEVNGVHRPDLDGATDISLDVTPFTHALPIRRLPLHVGHGADLSVLDVDVETLGVVPRQVTYERFADRSWRHRRGDVVTEFDVDEHGLPVDVGDRFRRSA